MIFTTQHIELKYLEKSNYFCINDITALLEIRNTFVHSGTQFYVAANGTMVAMIVLT